MPDFALHAVSTSRQESAAASAKAFNVLVCDKSRGSDRSSGLRSGRGSERVPHHHKLISAALAGKKVYGEWPLSNASSESGCKSLKISSLVLHALTRTKFADRAWLSPLFAVCERVRIPLSPP